MQLLDSGWFSEISLKLLSTMQEEDTSHALDLYIRSISPYCEVHFALKFQANLYIVVN